MRQKITNLVLLVILVLGLILFLNYKLDQAKNKLQFNFEPQINLPNLPDLVGSPTPVSVLKDSATQIAEAGIVIPTLEYRYLETEDYEGLATYLKSQQDDWSTLSFNFHQMEVTGVSNTYQKLQTNACNWVDNTQNPLCGWHEVGYLSVYKGIITGGTQNFFTSLEFYTLPDSIEETGRVERDGVVYIKQSPVLVVSLTGQACVTNVEESTPSPINYTDAIPENSYTLLTVDSQHLWLAEGASDINHEYLRLTAEKQAKVMALRQDNVRTLYDLVVAESKEGGSIYTLVTSIFNQDLAQTYGYRDIELHLEILPGNPLYRCDGTPVIK